MDLCSAKADHERILKSIAGRLGKDAGRNRDCKKLFVVPPEAIRLTMSWSRVTRDISRQRVRLAVARPSRGVYKKLQSAVETARAQEEFRKFNARLRAELALSAWFQAWLGPVVPHHSDP